MKVGILSMQKVINFGSYLQAYSLKKTIEGLGHDVSFIDIEKGQRLFTRKNKSRVRMIDKHILKRIAHSLYVKKRNRNFQEHYFHWLAADAPVKANECDFVIIGSDEVFNCCSPTTSWGMTTQLFGNVEKPCASYAASFGFTNYSDIIQNGIEKEIQQPLKAMKAISVRDRNSEECIRKLTGIVPQRHLDPVFLYDYCDEIKKQNKFHDYILVYSYDNRINSENEIKTIKEFAREHRKKLISFGLYQRWCDLNVPCSPYELLAYFDDADYVVTDTFHGAVISIKRNKKFAALVRDSNRNKLTDLLQKFDLTDRIVEDISQLKEILDRSIDYERVNQIIEDEKSRSIAYLKEVLK